MLHDASGPRVVEDAICAAYADAPPSLRTCNMHKCAEYRVSGWSSVSKGGASDQTADRPLAINNMSVKNILHEDNLD